MNRKWGGDFGEEGVGCDKEVREDMIGVTISFLEGTLKDGLKELKKGRRLNGSKLFSDVKI